MKNATPAAILTLLLLSGTPQSGSAGASLVEVSRAAQRDETQRLCSAVRNSLRTAVQDGQAQVQVADGRVHITLWQGVGRHSGAIEKVDSTSAERALLALQGFEQWRVRIVHHAPAFEISSSGKDSSSHLLPEDVFQFMHHNFDSPAPEVEVSAVPENPARGEWAELWLEPPTWATQPENESPFLQVAQPVLP